MRTCSHTQMVYFDILEPRYHDRMVLLKDKKLGVHNKIVFTRAPSMGTKPYYISGTAAKRYPTEFMTTKDGRQLRMRVIPEDALQDLEIVKGCIHLL